jgi:phosphoserine phosphatase
VSPRYAAVVRNVTVREVTQTIDAAAAREPGGAIAFDGDGTLWAGDIGEDFFEALLDRGLREASYEALVREASESALDTRGSAREIAYRIHAAYVAGAFPEERVCEIMTWAAAGWERAELDRFCGEVIANIGLLYRVHDEAMRVIEHARSVGVDVFLVSASPRAIVEQAAQVVGIDQAKTTAVREVCDALGIVQCAVERPIPYGKGKVTCLREKLGSRVLYAAFGDNAFDVPLLCEAQLPVAVRPKERLLDRSAEVPHLAVLTMD